MEPPKVNSRSIPNELSRSTFTDPHLQYYYDEYCEAMQQKANLDFPKTVKDMFNEYETFVLSALKNHQCFYYPRDAKAIKGGVTSVLVMMYRSYKIFQYYIDRLDSAEPHHLHQIIIFAYHILDSGRSATLNDLESEVYEKFGKVLKAVHKNCSTEVLELISDISRSILADLIHEAKHMLKRGPIFTLIMEISCKIGWALLQIVRNEMQNQGLSHLNFESRNDNELIFVQHHFIEYSEFLINYRLGTTSFKIDDIVNIIECSSISDYDIIDEGKIPKCPYFCKFVSTSDFLRNRPEFKAKFMENLLIEEKKRDGIIDDLVSEEAEKLLEAHFKEDLTKQAGRSSGKKSTKKGGKKTAGKGKRKVKQVKKKEPESIVEATSEVVEFIPPRFGTAPTKCLVDPREKAFATIVIGEYLLDRFLHPAIVSLGLNPKSYSWAEVQQAIESNLTGRFAKRKNFLRMCIRWVQKRNKIAHPEIIFDESLGQLWLDLDVIKAKLGETAYNQIHDFLKESRIPRLKSYPAPLSTFGRPDLGITPENIKKMFAVIRVSEFVLERTVQPACRQNYSVLALPKLENWKTDFPFLKKYKDLSEGLIDAAARLLKYRNELAHPTVSMDMVGAVVEAYMKDDPDYKVFLCSLSKK